MQHNPVNYVACQMIRPADAAKMLSISTAKCYELIASGALRSVRLENGRLIRVPLRALQELTDEAMRGAEGENAR